tara:strand:- start:597 stop:1931 length:1335 start_codon:yes stop_codon:yes gene_type:complete
MEINMKVRMPENASPIMNIVGIEEVANAPNNWSYVIDTLNHITQTVEVKKNGNLVQDYKLTLNELKSVVRKVNAELRKEGRKEDVLKMSGTKEDIIDRLDILCRTESEMLMLDAEMNNNIVVSQEQLYEFSKLGLLTDDLGASTQLGWNGVDVTSITRTGHSGIDKRTWVNSACEWDGFVGSEALNGYGTFTEERYLCNKNVNYARYGTDEDAECKIVEEEIRLGRTVEKVIIGYAAKGKQTCSLCGGDAIVPHHRPSVSDKNGKHLSMPFIEITNGVRSVRMSSASEVVVKKWKDAWGNQRKRAVRQPCKQRIGTVPVHLQKKGARVWVRRNGKRYATDCYLQQVVVETDFNSQLFSVWMAIECSPRTYEDGTRIENKKILDRIHQPRPSRMAVTMANAVRNDKKLNYVRASIFNEDGEDIMWDELQYKADVSNDIEDGAGVV